MEKFIKEDFVLESDLAVKLYDQVKNLPIVDYHSHLSAQEIYENKRFKSITEAWLYHDHYKWRQMRTLGIDENTVTGDVSDLEKFKAFAKTLDYAIGNPLMAWSHLELQRYFGIDDVLTEANAEEIFNRANAVIETGAVDVRKIIEKSNVKMIGTTDDVVDNLKWHKLIASDETIDVKVLPTFRPDRFLNIDSGFYAETLKDLEALVGPITSLDVLKKAFKDRLDYFAEAGCKISDHGISNFDYIETTDETASLVFIKFLSGEKLTEEEEIRFKSNLLVFFGDQYKERNWVMQLHIGATRNNNAKLFETLGADVGADAIADKSYIQDLSNYLKTLSATDSLGKTIVYNLNPQDNYAVATMVGAFQQGPTKGLIQFGSGWWFNDQRDGIEAHLKAHGQLGLLRVFVGMLTDSRSFLSFTRHEYFRRILCNLIADFANTGQYPNDFERLSAICSEISSHNAIEYFELGE